MMRHTVEDAALSGDEAAVSEGQLSFGGSGSSIAVNVIATVAVIFLLRYGMELFVPVVLAILLSYALDPVVVWVTWLKIPRAGAALLVLLVLLGGMGFSAYKLRNQAMIAIESLPEAADRIKETVRTPGKGAAEDTVGKLQVAAEHVQKAVAEATGTVDPPSRVPRVRIEEPSFRSSDFLWTGSMGLLYGAGQAVMVLSLALFLLASGDLFKRKVVTIIGDRFAAKRLTLEAINEINRHIERFLVMQIVTGVIVAGGTAAILWGFGVAQPLIWGIAAGLTSVVPYFGAMAVVGAIALVTFMQTGSASTTVGVTAAMVVFRTMESMFLIPALMGKAAGINGVAMFLGLLFWGWAWGTIGLIVAVPLMMVFKIVCDRTEGLHSLGELLGERAAKA